MATGNYTTHEGALYRATNYREPLRPVFDQHFPRIENGQQLRASLRAGEWAWPGGYRLAFITSDGACLCYSCARKEIRNITDSIRHTTNDGWRVVAMDIVEHYEEPEWCAHCNKNLNFERGEIEV